MKELQLLKPDKNIVIPGERRERKLIGTLRKINGLTLFEYEVATDTLRSVILQDVTRTVRNVPASYGPQYGISEIGYMRSKYGKISMFGILNTPVKVSRLIIKPGCSYVQALNEKVARKKLGIN